PEPTRLPYTTLFRSLFRKVMAENKRERLPLITALRTSSSRMGLSVMAAVLGIGGFFLVSTFMINYGTAKLGVAKSVMLNATLVGDRKSTRLNSSHVK